MAPWEELAGNPPKPTSPSPLTGKAPHASPQTIRKLPPAYLLGSFCLFLNFESQLFLPPPHRLAGTSDGAVPTGQSCGNRGAGGVRQPPGPPRSRGKIPPGSGSRGANEGPLTKAPPSEPLPGHPGNNPAPSGSANWVLRSQGRILVTPGVLGWKRSGCFSSLPRTAGLSGSLAGDGSTRRRSSPIFGASLGRSGVYLPPTALRQLPPQKIIIITVIIIKQLCSRGIHWDLLWFLSTGGRGMVYYLSRPPPGAEAL